MRIRFHWLGDPPAWLMEWTEFAAHALGLDGWNLYCKAVDPNPKNPGKSGHCLARWRYLTADIDLVPDETQVPNVLESVVHELLHCVTNRQDAAVQGHLVPYAVERRRIGDKPAEVKAHLLDLWEDQNEPVITHLSRILTPLLAREWDRLRPDHTPLPEDGRYERVFVSGHGGVERCLDPGPGDAPGGPGGPPECPRLASDAPVPG